MANIIGPFGTNDIELAVGESIVIQANLTSAKVYLLNTAVSFPPEFILEDDIENETITLGPYAVVRTVRIEETGGVGQLVYDAGVSPVIPPIGYQGDPTAATVSATLTAAEILAGIITVNQGASGASAQTLPLATALDAALPDSNAGYAFDFAVTNISTDAAEDCTMTTNTGWTLVGAMVVASNAAATDKSAGLFRARKTAAGAWSLYRLS